MSRSSPSNGGSPGSPGTVTGSAHRPRPRRGKNSRPATALESRALWFIAEQLIVSVDQLARFLKLTSEEAHEIAKELQGELWVSHSNLVENDEWLYLRGAGWSEVPIRLRAWADTGINRLTRRAAITEIRLALEEATWGDWTGDRLVRHREETSYPHRSLAGVLEVQGKRHAVLLMQGPANWEVARRLFRYYRDRFDLVECFCSDRARRSAELARKDVGGPIELRRLPPELTVTRRNRPNPRPRLTQTQRQSLRLISEQHCLREDQLQRFFGLSRTRTRTLVGALERHRCLRRVELIAGEPPSLWLRRAGVEEAGTGFAYQAPSVYPLIHHYAINDARIDLHERYPAGHWVCERQLLRDAEVHRKFAGRDAFKYVRPESAYPDGVLLVDDKRYAIEVELTQKTKSELLQIIEERLTHYDKVFYFCSPAVRHLVDEIHDRLQCPDLIVEDAQGLPAEDRRGPAKRPSVLLAPEDVELLRLMAEQGGIPTDQLMRFLRCDEDATKTRMMSLVANDLIWSTRTLADEPRWWWLRGRGARLSGTGLSPLPPRTSALEKLRAFNEARLALAPPDSEATWISRRMLEKDARWTSGMPKGIATSSGTNRAVQIQLSRTWKPPHVRDVEQWSAEYDEVVWMCRPCALDGVSTVIAERRWQNVITHPLLGLPADTHH